MKPEGLDNTREISIKSAIDFVDVNSSRWASGGPMGNITESQQLPDGRTIRAKITRSGKGDIDTEEASPSEDEVRPLVERLLETGKSFTVLSGSSDDTLEVEFSMD